MWSNAALSLYWVSIGLGRHIEQVPKSQHHQLALIFYVDNILYITGLTMIKLSVILFYVRIFRPIAIYRIAFWATASIVVGWFLAGEAMSIWTCIPIRKAWNPTLPGHCLDRSRKSYGTAISNILIDLIILVLPMPMLWRLNIEASRKIGLIGVFAAGYWQV